MDRSDAGDLRSAVEWRWSCAASLIQTVPVVAPLEGERTWSVVVHIFELSGCDKANRAYAWSSPMQNGEEIRIFSSLHIGPLNSPPSVVRAAVADELRVTRLAMRQGHHRATSGHPVHAPLFRSPALSQAS
jgi:hypothetical protein